MAISLNQLGLIRWRGFLVYFCLSLSMIDTAHLMVHPGIPWVPCSPCRDVTVHVCQSILLSFECEGEICPGTVLTARGPDPSWQLGQSKLLIGALIAPKMHSTTVHLHFDFYAQKTNQGHWTPSLDLQSYIRIIGSGCRHQYVATQWTSQAHGARGAKESINHWAAELTRHLTISWADFSGQSHNALLRQLEHELCILLKWMNTFSLANDSWSWQEEQQVQMG